MKVDSTQEKKKTKSKQEEGPSQQTLDYLMLLARSSGVEKGDKIPIQFDVCLN